MSQSEAARALGMSRRRLHEIVHGQRAMTPDTAIRCALLFGTDAAFWLALQSAWDSFHAWKALRATPHATLRAALTDFSEGRSDHEPESVQMQLSPTP